MTSVYYMYPIIMTEVNVSATLVMSVTVGGGGGLQEWGKCQRQRGNVSDCRGNDCNSGEMSTAVGECLQLTVGEMSTTVGKLNITSEDTWNNI